MTDRIWPHLVYYVGPPVWDERFVDRDRTIELLRSAADNATCPGFVLRGPRRTGKTSVLRRFAHLAADDTHVVELDLLSILGFEQTWLPHTVAGTVLANLCDALGVEDYEPAGLRLHNSTLAFRQTILRKLVDKVHPKRLTVLFDEMEVAEDCDPQAPLELVGALRPLPGFPSMKRTQPLIGVVWGRPFGTGVRRGVPNPLKDFLSDEIGRFDRPDMRIALERPLKGLYVWSDEAVSEAVRLTDGHPLFTAALGAAVHAGRKPGMRTPVSLEEAEAAIPRALQEAQSWDDAWRQLHPLQALFLRSLAEEERPDAQAVVDRLRTWDPSYDAAKLEPLIQGLQDDHLIGFEDGAFFVRGGLIRHWIARRTPREIFAVRRDEPRMALLPEANRREEEGAQQFANRDYAAAAASFRAALALDPRRESTALWLTEALLKLDEAMPVDAAVDPDGEPAAEAARVLRGFLPTAAMRDSRAKVLTYRLKKALAAHQEASLLLAELRDVDPGYKAPEAARLAATVEVGIWWRALETANPTAARELIDQYVLSNPRAVSMALRRIREALEAPSGDPAVPRELLLSVVAPRLLLLSEPLAFPQDGRDNTAGAELIAEWPLCYARVLSFLPATSQTAGAFTPPVLRELMNCKASASPLGAPLRAHVAETFTKDRLVELACSDADAALTAMSLLQDADAEQAEQVLGQAAADIGPKGDTVNKEGVEAALNVLPRLGLRLNTLAIKLHPSHPNAYVDDLTLSAQYLIERVAGDPICASIDISPAVREDWLRLLDLLAQVDAAYIRSRLIAWLEQRHDGDNRVNTTASMPGNARLSEGTLTKILGPNYKIVRRTPYPIVGLPPGYVTAWEMEQQGGKWLLARLYRVEGGEPEVHDFLRQLWEGERRLLSTLATRWEGRSLPKMQVARLEPELGVLVLVTDMVGPQTLRDLLSAGEIARLRKSSRARLWEHLRGVVDALGALHRASYLHRSIRPDNIKVDQEAGTLLGRQWLRVTNFEWSVYLYNLAGSQPAEQRIVDRYVAPETLAVHRGGKMASQYLGEGMASDVFCLGLVLFECLVGPLTADELRRVPASYTVDDHVEWIKSLMARINDAQDAGELWADEVLLLKDMLQPIVTRRIASIDEILIKIAELARRETLEAAVVTAYPLQVVGTLDPGNPASIASYIGRHLPDLKDRLVDAQSVAEWLEEELKTAVVHPNRGNREPLFLACPSINFVVRPFVYNNREYRHAGWLQVAQDHDAPAGPSLGRLSGAKAHNYRRDMSMSPLLAGPTGWDPWFAAAAHFRDSLTNDERAFVERVRWSIELERQSWSSEVRPYSLVPDSYVPAKRLGDVDVVEITDRGGEHKFTEDDDQRRREPTIADLMASSADRQNTYFELGDSDDPTAAFHFGKRWIQVENDPKRRTVRLIRYRDDLSERPPREGWIRPYSLAGHLAIYNRRRAVLKDVENDAYLVRSLLTPQATFDDMNLPRGRSFIDRLDLDKIALCDAIQNRRPLFVLQGPPGTGKTTLAAEVIMRTLHEQPSARILIVAQAHDPLNNLLERVEEALAKQSTTKGRRPMSVRLSSQERLDERRYGAESTRVPRRFHPSQVAAQRLDEARRWKPPADRPISQPSLDLWKAVCETQAMQGISRSLQNRLVASANLVYATANDRRLAGLKPGSFDLVIYEEAAKALPAELLGPLRLARRWLLIGDQAQLPPFGLQAMEGALSTAVNELRQNKDGGLEADRILGDVPAPADKWAGVTAEMLKLLRFFRYLHEKAGEVFVPAAPSTAALPPEVVRGLSGMLTTQWRMHPTIGTFVSECFYDRKVKNGSPVELAKWRRHSYVRPEAVRDRHIVWLDVPWAEDQPAAAEWPGFGGGYESTYEARALLGFLKELLRNSNMAPNVAILSPYRAQVRNIQKLFAGYKFGGSLKENEQFELGDKIHTVDSFQGRQADVVAISMVRNRPIPEDRAKNDIRYNLGFLENAARSTVIFSRAEKLMVVAGSLSHFARFSDTKMAKVAKEIRTLNDSPKSGVTILPADDFIDDRHFSRLLTSRQEAERRQRQRARLGQPDTGRDG